MQLPTLTKDGHYFAGWYLDAEFKTPFTNLTVYPSNNITVYAKWIENGVITQNFESYDHSLSANAGFELYTATDTNDTNVYEGEHSLYRSTVSSTKVAALSDKYIKLNIGKAYKLTFKLKVTELGTGGQIQFTDLKDRTNAWSYSKLSNMIYIGTDYSLPYAEEYFNILSQNEISGVPNQQGKSVYKINVDTRSDYVFTASLAKGKNGSPKVYLAWVIRVQKFIAVMTIPTRAFMLL